MNLLNSGEILNTISYQQLFDSSLVLLAGLAFVGFFIGRFRRRSPAAGKSGKLAGLCLFSCFLMLVSVLLLIGIQGQSRILISEFYLPDKDTTIPELESYIEIANEGSLLYDGKALYLSDDPNNLQKYQLSQTRIAPKGAVLIPVDENVFAFGRRGGDLLILSNENGEVLDQVITGDTRQNKAYARCYADKTWNYRDPSPGVYNLEKPAFSMAPGFYEDAFYVRLYAQDGADIYFTVDGSIPTTESEKYAEEILVYDRSEEENTVRSIRNVTKNWLGREWDETRVPKARIIRAIAVNADGFASEVATATYFVNQEEFQDHYVVSLVADPEDLFGPQGIYSTGEAYDQWYLNGQEGDEPKPNYEVRGMECSGNFELFHATKYGYLNQLCGLRIQGGSNRVGILKRFSIFSREVYSGSEFFDQNIFDNIKTHSVVLRGGFMNACSMYMVPERSLATQKSIPVAVFLNGEFWYYTYLQEKYSDELLEDLYDLEDAEFIKAGVTEEMLAFVQENDMQTEDAYRRLNELVDIQSYVDFMCTNIYLANTDYAEGSWGGNSAIWRSRKVENQTYGDGRWRWALYDMDLVTAYCRYELGLENITDAQLDTFTQVRPWTGTLDSRPFYSALKSNPLFRQQFVLSFMDMANTCFSPEAVEKVLNQWGEDLSYNDSFFLERKQYITRYLADAYDLTGTQETLNLAVNMPEAGRIRVNTCWPELADGSWSGTYYTDYPVTVTAEETAGYRFVRWEGDISSEDPMISFTLPEGGASIYAVYEPWA